MIAPLRVNAQDAAPEPTGLPVETHFKFRTNNNKFYLGVGATSVVSVSYDFHAPLDDPDMFVPFSIPMSVAPGQSTRIQASARQTGIRINAVALPGQKDQVGIFASVLLLSENYTPSPEYAYVTWRGLTAGYNYGLFDSNCSLPGIDYEGPNAMTAMQSAVLDYNHSFTDSWSAGIGMEIPLFSATYGSRTSEATQRIPDIPVKATYSWGDDSEISAAALLRNMCYYDQVQSKTKVRTGWGVELFGNFRILPGLRGAFQAVAGRGIASYIEDLNGGGLDLTPTEGAPGRMIAVKVWGGFAGLQYNFTPKVFMTGTYSHVRAYCGTDTGRAEGGGSQYRYSQYATGNLFWDAHKFLRVGIEYIWGRRVDMNGASNHSSRLQAALIVNI